VRAHPRRLTPEQLASHVEILALLARLVRALPADRLLHRSFVVMTAPDVEHYR